MSHLQMSTGAMKRLCGSHGASFFREKAQYLASRAWEELHIEIIEHPMLKYIECVYVL